LFNRAPADSLFHSIQLVTDTLFIRHESAATLRKAAPVGTLLDMIVITRLTHRISIGQPPYLVDMSLVRYTDRSLAPLL
jgi:hypothetical protein